MKVVITDLGDIYLQQLVYQLRWWGCKFDVVNDEGEKMTDEELQKARN